MSQKLKLKVFNWPENLMMKMMARATGTGHTVHRDMSVYLSATINSTGTYIISRHRHRHHTHKIERINTEISINGRRECEMKFRMRERERQRKLVSG